MARLFLSRALISLKLAGGKNPAGFLGQLVFLGLGVDERAAAILVARLDEYLAGGRTVAFEGNLHSSRSSQRLGVAASARPTCCSEAAARSRRSLGLTAPADAGARCSTTSLNCALGIDHLGLDLEVGARRRDGFQVQTDGADPAGEGVPELISRDDEANRIEAR